MTSVPYWDGRCGLTFAGAVDFEARLEEFLDANAAGAFLPRGFVLDELTLAKCAAKYLAHVDAASAAGVVIAHE